MTFYFEKLTELADFLDNRARDLRLEKAGKKAKELNAREAYGYEQSAYMIRNSIVGKPKKVKRGRSEKVL